MTEKAKIPPELVAWLTWQARLPRTVSDLCCGWCKNGKHALKPEEFIHLRRKDQLKKMQVCGADWNYCKHWAELINLTEDEVWELNELRRRAFA